MKYFYFLLMICPIMLLGQETDDLSPKLLRDLENSMTAYRFHFGIYPSQCSFEPLSQLRMLGEGEHYDIEIYPNTDFSYPGEDIELLSIYVNSYLSKPEPGFTRKIIYSHGYRRKNQILIGVSKSAPEKLLFISGAIFKNCIQQDFDLNVEKPDSFKLFIKLKLFNYDVKDIKFVKKNKKNIFFEAISKNFIEKIIIKIDRNNFDYIQVKSVSGYTEMDSYKWID